MGTCPYEAVSNTGGIMKKISFKVRTPKGFSTPKPKGMKMFNPCKIGSIYKAKRGFK